MRMSALVAAAGLAIASGPALAQAGGGGDGGGSEISGTGLAPGYDFCRNSSAPFDCAVARSKLRQAVSGGADISIKVKRTEQDKTSP